MVDAVTFRTDDNARWGTGQGSDLSATEIDINFWVLLTAVQALQAQSNENAGIDHFVITGTNLFVHLTNHFVLGPYTLPTAQWNFLGEWRPSHAYQAFDVVTNQRAIYLVLLQHTSRVEFAAGAANDNAQPYYGLLLAAAPAELPDDGALGQLLQWQTSPADVRWITPTRNIAMYVEGTPDPVEKVMEYVFPENTTLPMNLAASQFSVGTRPTAVNQEFDLYQDGGPIGSVTIHHTGAPTIVFNHDIVFTAGEVLTVVAPTVPDAHMTRIRFTFVGLLP